MKRAAWCLNSGFVSSSIGQTLANDALGQILGSHKVIGAKRNAVVIAEIKFREIAMQVLFTAMLIHATHTALEN